MKESGTMKIEWVNHASYIVHQDDISLICDPWIGGSAFNNGWSLLAQTRLTSNDFARITHIWFSHEHPDHFSPPNLTSIPASARQKITILYQKTRDKKVVKFCEKLGFADVIELPAFQEVALGPHLSVRCGNIDSDSWLYAIGRNYSILNLNDCVIDSFQSICDIKDRIGPADVLLTQFSYAQFEGNRDDKASRARAAARKIKQIEWELEAIRPKFVIPFASFIWFSHQDNYYMNDCVNRIGDVHSHLLELDKAEPVVMYPGDVWTLGNRHDSQSAIRKYADDYCRISENAKLTEPAKVDVSALIDAAERFRRQALKWHPKSCLRAIQPIRFFVADLHRAFQFSFQDGLIPAEVDRCRCDLSLSSDSLKYCFDFDWGFNTIHVNGCFESYSAQGLSRFKAYGRVSNMMNQGVRLQSLLEQKLRQHARRLPALNRQLKKVANFGRR
jgi:hypothetical protein